MTRKKCKFGPYVQNRGGGLHGFVQTAVSASSRCISQKYINSVSAPQAPILSQRKGSRSSLPERSSPGEGRTLLPLSPRNAGALLPAARQRRAAVLWRPPDTRPRAFLLPHSSQPAASPFTLHGTEPPRPAALEINSIHSREPAPGASPASSGKGPPPGLPSCRKTPGARQVPS